MAQNFRHSEILTIAREAGKVTVEGLAAHFNVTAQTIRRDLADLCDVGQLTRVHGGAMIPSGVIALGYEDRRSLASQEKDAIARLVAAQIPDGVSIFMNIGTTTEAVARALLKHRNLMVITNNLNVANILATSPNSEVIVAGGILRRSDGALVGDVTAEFIGQFKVDYAIIGSAAVDPDGSLLDYDFREVRVAQAIIKNARKSYLVADHTKFKMVAPVRIASLAELDGFFTDIQPPKSVIQLCADNDVFIRTVESAPRRALSRIRPSSPGPRFRGRSSARRGGRGGFRSRWRSAAGPASRRPSRSCPGIVRCCAPRIAPERPAGRRSRPVPS